jgi:hypothetical protein
MRTMYLLHTTRWPHRPTMMGAWFFRFRFGTDHRGFQRTTSRGRSRTGKGEKQLAGLQPVEASMANGFMSQAAGFNFCNLPQ